VGWEILGMVCWGFEGVGRLAVFLVVVLCYILLQKMEVLVLITLH
jgi:hypothetical protein